MRPTLRTFAIPLAVLACALPCSERAAAQAGDSLALRAADAGGNSCVIVLAYHDDASMQYDIALGEKPIPPIPAVEAFDVRFLDPPGIRRTPPTGSYRDIRPRAPVARIDTFRIRVQPQNGAFPVRLSWDARQARRFAGARICTTGKDGGNECDMRRAEHVDLDAGTEPELLLVVRR